MADTIGYLPNSAKDFYDAMIRAKRELVTTENLRWSNENLGDAGIAILKVASELGGTLAKYADSRITQNQILYAVNNEAVHSACRGIGYKIKGAIAAKLVVLITTNGAQTIPSGAKLEKVLEDGTKIYFELLDESVFTGAGSKFAYVLQGETTVTTFTGDNSANQEFIIPDFPVAYGGIVFAVGSYIWTEVDDFVNSNGDSKHYVVEADFTGQPTVITGDGVYGAKPATGAVITLAWRNCDGNSGNVAPGEMSFVSRFAHVTGVTNEAPSKAELNTAVAITDTTIEVVDDGSISSFKDSGVAYIDEDSFTYTSIVGNTFQGVSGLENPHILGEEVTYSSSYTFGQNRETNKQAKVSAIRRNRAKESANSLLDYEYLISQVPGVARVKATASLNVISAQIVPADGGNGAGGLLQGVMDYMVNRKNAVHTLSVVYPNYVYVDVVCEVAPGAGYNYTSDVKPVVLETIQNYLNPLVKDDSSLYYLNGWGNLLKKNLVEANIFELYNRALVSDVEITVFKKSTDTTGNSNIQLQENEIAQIGSITVTQKGVSYAIPPGEMGGNNSESITKMARVIV